MGCSRCANEKPNYPKPNEWGPLFWKIFHTLAERAGKQSGEPTKGDEMRAWPLFVKCIAPVIPCEECRSHYESYVAAHPFTLPDSYTAWNSYIRLWFYNLHEWVNQRLEKDRFPFDSLQGTYNSFQPLSTWISDLETLQLRAMKQNGITLLAWKAWLKQYKMLRAAL